MADIPRRIASELSDRLRSPETAALVAGIESKLTRRRREQKMESGAFRGMAVVVYRGFVAADDVAKVRVRVLEVPELPGDSRIPYWDTAQANLRRHAALPIVGAEVELSIGRHSAREVTDGHGFANFALPVPRLKAGWHQATAVITPIEGGESATGTGHVVKPPKAPFLVISDIDDTILLTGLTEGVTMVARTVLREASQRGAIAGMSSLYRGLVRGVSDRSGNRSPEPTFFYVSTGSWSFYPMLQQFVQLRAFPQGPMFLTDWRPTERYLRRSGAEHKRTAIRRLFEAYPTMSFVLFGDSGQRDPLTYEEMAREFPGRVTLIVIRQVGDDEDERNSELREHAEALRDEGIPLHLVPDATEAAQLAHDLGLCDEETLVEVRTEFGPR